MPAAIPMVASRRFDRLVTVSANGHDKRGNAVWLCRCDCGAEKVAKVTDLTHSMVRSCGCLRSDKTTATNKRIRTTHGRLPREIHSTWTGMLARCRNKNHVSYPGYGGRGITVCAEWHDFVVFRKWAIENRHAPGLTIERRNNDGNYEPDNCRWATHQEQSNNRRTSRYLTIDGVSKTLTEHCRARGISVSTAHRRLKNGENPEHVFLSRRSA